MSLLGFKRDINESYQKMPEAGIEPTTYALRVRRSTK